MTTNSDETEQQPENAVVVIGEAMFLQPSLDVLYVTILSKSAMRTALTSAQSASLQHVHVIIKGVDICSLYNENAISDYTEYLKECGEITVHALVNNVGTQPTEDDMEAIQTSLVLAGLKITNQGNNPDGSKTMTGTKETR
jgi:hypothetical protein